VSALFRTCLVSLTAVALLAGCGGQQTPPGRAAVVNGDAVPTARYDLLVSSAQRRIESSGFHVDWSSARGKTRLREIQAQSVRLAVRDAVIEQMARKRGVQVGDPEVDEALRSLEELAGGAGPLDQRLELEGLTRAQYRSLLRYTLLDRKLRALDDQYDAHLASALRAAGVEAYVGPCASDHRYPRCVDER